MKKPAIGKNLRHIRELNNLTQEYVADQLGISTRAYSKIETEETEITVVRLYAISEILNVSVIDILGFEPSLVFNNNSSNQEGGSFIAYNNTQIDQVKQLYEKLLQEKDRLIAHLESKYTSS